MQALTQAQLDTKIDSFLEAKFAKYPELNHPAAHKAKWSIEGVWGNVSKPFGHRPDDTERSNV